MQINEQSDDVTTIGQHIEDHQPPYCCKYCANHVLRCDDLFFRECGANRGTRAQEQGVTSDADGAPYPDAQKTPTMSLISAASPRLTIVASRSVFG
jgi:hypothetical protein